MTYVVAAMVVVMVCETWCLWRVLEGLGVLQRVEDRLSNLAHMLLLLTDTTETCFQVVADQLEQESSQKSAPSAGRAARQRRVVGAARRGRSVTEIAVEEKVAESEVRLRLHLAEQNNSSERGLHGPMLR
jgi:hypothetical protein